MAKIFENAVDDVGTIARRVIKARHAERFAEHPVMIQFDYIFVSTEDGPALKLAGHPCAAIVKIIGLKDRAMGRKDAEIQIDKAIWNDLTERSQCALLDHEFTHIRFAKDRDMNFKTDDMGRPVLKMRMHDYNFGWFNEVAQHWGIDSMEVKQAKTIVRETGQMYFPFEPDLLQFPNQNSAKDIAVS